MASVILLKIRNSNTNGTRVVIRVVPVRLRFGWYVLELVPSCPIILVSVAVVHPETISYPTALVILFKIRNRLKVRKGNATNVFFCAVNTAPFFSIVILVSVLTLFPINV